MVILIQTLGLIPGSNRGTASAQESVKTFTLAQSISYALRNSREFEVAQKDVELADEKVKEARAAFLPQLMLDTGYTFNGDLSTIVLDGNFLANLNDLLPENPSLDKEVDGTSAEPIEIELGSEHNFQGKAKVTYPLFTWGQLGNIYRQAVLGKQAVKRALEAVQLDIELKVRQVFHGVLLAQAFVDVVEQSLAQVERRYELVQEQKAAGVTTRLEVIRANVQVVNTRSQLIQARNQRKLAEENFKLTLGLPLDKTVSIDGRLHAELKSVNIDQAIATALERRPEIQQIEIQEQIGEKQVKVAKAGNKPMLSTFGNYIFNDSERQSFDASWNVGVAIQLPIFDGFATRARVNQARLSLDQIRTNKDQLLDSIKLGAKSAVFDLEAVRKLIEAQEGIVEQAAEGLRIANVQHEVGLITGVELTDVELSHTQAQVNRLQAIHDYIIAVARLERAIGARLE
jgi:outer membrane protein TolC